LPTHFTNSTTHTLCCDNPFKRLFSCRHLDFQPFSITLQLY